MSDKPEVAKPQRRAYTEDERRAIRGRSTQGGLAAFRGLIERQAAEAQESAKR